MAMKKISRPILLLSFVFLFACGDGGGSGDGASSTPGAASGMQKFSNEDYNALSNEQKFAASNKLATTLFKGVPANEFFDTTRSINADINLFSNANYIADIETKLSKPVENEDEIRSSKKRLLCMVFFQTLHMLSFHYSTQQHFFGWRFENI